MKGRKRKKSSEFYILVSPTATDLGKAPIMYIVPYWIWESVEIDGLAPGHVVFTGHVVMSKVSVAMLEELNTTHRQEALPQQRRGSVSGRIHHLRNAKYV